jgi:hypothetical protein
MGFWLDRVECSTPVLPGNNQAALKNFEDTYCLYPVGYLAHSILLSKETFFRFNLKKEWKNKMKRLCSINFEQPEPLNRLVLAFAKPS